MKTSYQVQKEKAAEGWRKYHELLEENTRLKRVKYIHRYIVDETKKPKFVADVYNEQCGRLIAAAPEMLEMLKELEFPVKDTSGFHVLCRFCQGRMEHAPDCKLGKLLREVEG